MVTRLRSGLFPSEIRVTPATGALYYSTGPAACNYDNLLGNSGAVISPAIDLTFAIAPKLQLNYLLGTEVLCTWDAATIDISADFGPYATLAGNCFGGLADPTTGWEFIQFDLSGVCWFDHPNPRNL